MRFPLKSRKEYHNKVKFLLLIIFSVPNVHRVKFMSKLLFFWLKKYSKVIMALYLHMDRLDVVKLIL